MKIVFNYIKQYIWLFISAIIFISLESVMDLLQPTMMSKMIDQGVKNSNFQIIMRFGIIMIIVALFGALFAVLRSIIASYVSSKVGNNLRKDLYKKILSLPREDTDKFEGAALITRLTNDITVIQNFVNGTMRIFVKAPITCLGAIAMASVLSKKMALILAVIFPVGILIIFLSVKFSFPWFLKMQENMDKLGAVMREYLAGIRVVRTFNRADYEEKRFSKTAKHLADTGISASKVISVFGPAISLTVNLGIVTVLFLASRAAGQGDFEVGKISAFVMYMTQILHSLMLFSNIVNMFTRASASANRVTEVLRQENHMPENGNNFKPDFNKAAIVFGNVSFSYPGAGIHVLENINFSAAKGQSIGIIGATGSGKSTLINLMMRFYDVTKGGIKIFGNDVRDMDIKELRKIISIVPQKSYLFSGTIMDNLKWGNEDASREEIDRVLKDAAAEEFVYKYKDGLNTVLGQGGVNLSGGQKQRLCIARALLRNPKIMILDDSVSAVDIHTEIKIVKALKDLSKGLCSVIIAQKISSVMNLDLILVLDKGGIAGMGTHKELMESSEVYRDIYRSQIGKEDDLSGI